MHIQARIENRPGNHIAGVSTNGEEKEIPIAARPEGGSSTNGGVAEIHNTLRQGVDVTLAGAVATPS